MCSHRDLCGFKSSSVDMLIVQEIICPYCNNLTAFVDSETIYGKSYGMVYYCKDCDAYVGTHKGTSKPLGRVANRELRIARAEAHKYFDRLCQAAVSRGRTEGDARAAADRWLASKMEHPAPLTQLGRFDLTQCKNVISICKPYAERLL